MMEANDESQSDPKHMMDSGDNGGAVMASKNGDPSSSGMVGGGPSSSNDMSGNSGKYSSIAAELGFDR